MVVKLPQGAYSTKDLLPNGVLVHDSGVGELALLVVAPTGKIVYWESVSSAANADPIRQKQQGLHGSISGMLSGEVISTVADAEPDGFILTSTAGRAIHISVRDPQGRPAITAQFLRNDNASTGGLFGGIKNVFSSAGWRREIAAVRAGPLRGKNHRQCIVAFSYGVFQIWDLARHSRKTLGYELDSKPQILIATTSVNPALKNGYDFRILDFTLHPHSVDADGEGHRVFALTEFVRNREARYYLLDMTLHDGAPTVSMVHPITCSTSPLKDDKPWPAFKPRVFLPEPGHTAFAIFDDHLIMVSLSKIEESPSSQLQIESHTLSEPFQDILFFAKGSNYHVVGCTVDMLTDKESDKATCLIFANGFGLIRAGAFPAAEGETATERRVSSCRSRIEQAVFFGDKPNNLFEFGLGMGVDDWEDDEVEAAALAVNQSILVCKSRYIPVITPSLETQLKQRAIAMAELIKLVRTRTLKHSTRWELLWSAEKMAAARAFWQVNQEHLKTFKDPEKKTLLWEMIDMLSENYKHENRPNYGETDVVRHYLTYDVADIELVVPWAQNTLQELEKEGVTQPDRRGPFLSQANDIAIMGLQTVFRFREANAELYGLGKDMVDDGVYQGSYEGIKVPWTGIVETVTGMRAHSALCEEFCQEMMGTQDLTEDDDAIDDDLFDKLGKDISDLIHLFCQVSDERLRWLKVQPDPIDQDEYKNLALMYPEARKDLIVGLFDLDIYADPITLGERYADMPALAEVLSSGLAVGNERMMIAEDQGEEDDDAAIMVDEYLKKNFTYFKTYGLKWANAWYTKQIQMAEFAPTIPESNRPLLTEFLQSNPNYAKLAWMREAIHGKDYKRAADTIYSLQKEDSDLWSKRIELSLSKLSLLAAKEKRQVTDEKLAKMSRIISRRIGIIDIQQRLYQYTRPALRNATDRIAELQLAMEEFGVLVKDRPYFFDLLRNNFEKVINTRALEAEDVIDTLTLMNAGSGLVDEDDFAGKRFFYALQILNITGLASTDPDRKELHERVIWRRCLLQDDWTALNRTDAKDDTLVSSEIEQTALFKTLKAGFVDGIPPTSLHVPIQTNRNRSTINRPPTPPSLRTLRSRYEYKFPEGL